MIKHGTGTVYVVMGGQYGSEGKGEFCKWFAERYDIHHIVRTGGPNAGHTVTYDHGTYKMRHIPTAWGLHDRLLYLAPGALIDLEVLRDEMAMINERSFAPTMFVDESAIIIEERHKAQERVTKKRDRIGSTQEGIGAARVDHLRRDGSITSATEARTSGLRDIDVVVGDVSEYLNSVLDKGQDVLLESTQGFGLSLTASGNYPYVTSRDITPGILLNDAGLGGYKNFKTIAVCRTFPIRVAGNSGPLPREISWEDMMLIAPHIKEPETTTVTGLTRRIACNDQELHDRMVRICRPDATAVSFVDYRCPEAYMKQGDEMQEILSRRALTLGFHNPRWVSTGPGAWTTV